MQSFSTPVGLSMDSAFRECGSGTTRSFLTWLPGNPYMDFMGQATQQIAEHVGSESDAATGLPAVAIEKLTALASRYDAERLALARRARRRWRLFAIPTTLVAAIIGLAVVSAIEKRFGPVGMMAAAGGVFSLWLLLLALPAFFIREPARLAEATFRRDLTPALFPFVGRLQYYEGGRPSEMERLSKTRLFTFFHSEHRHTLTGDFEGLPFLVTQAELVRGHVKIGGTRRRAAAFAGILVRLPPPDGFGGTLLVRSLSVGGFHLPPDPVRGEARLFTSGDAELDRRLSLFSDRQEAHAPLAKAVGQTVVTMMDTGPHGQIHLAITEKDCFVLLTPSRGFLELPGLDTSIDVERHLVPAANDLHTLLITAKALRAVAGSPPAMT